MRRAPRVVLWGGRADDLQFGSRADRRRARLLADMAASRRQAAALQAAFAAVARGFAEHMRGTHAALEAFRRAQGR